MADADRLLELARQAQDALDADSAERQAIVEAAELLGQLLLQDVKRGGDGDGAGDDANADADGDGGVSLKEGVSKDRMVSVHDPEMRHGHKSKSKRFDGHKAAVVVDTDSQLITAVDVLPGNAADNLGALELVEQSEASADVAVVEAMGDTAYGDGGTRQAFADAGRKLVARVPGRPNRKCFPKDDFVIDLVAGSCTCPAGQITRTIVPAGKRTDGTGTVHRLQAFRFDGAVCQGCLLRSRCFTAKGMKGRQVLIHPQEGLLQEARALQQSADYDQYRQRRVVAEHRLARLEQLGIRQARYFGRVKTKFQLYLAATVANLTLLANQTGVFGDPGDNPDRVVTTTEIGGNLGVDHHLLPTWVLAWLRSPTQTLSLFQLEVSASFLVHEPDGTNAQIWAEVEIASDGNDSYWTATAYREVDQLYQEIAEEFETKDDASQWC